MRMRDLKVESLLLLPLLVTIFVVVMTVGNRRASLSSTTVTQLLQDQSSSSSSTQLRSDFSLSHGPQPVATPDKSFSDVAPVADSSVTASTPPDPSTPDSSSSLTPPSVPGGPGATIVTTPDTPETTDTTDSAEDSTDSTEEDDQSCSCPTTISETVCSKAYGVVMGGLDFVQYFTTFANADGTYDESQVGYPGLSQYSTTYHGFTYYFLSEANQALFEQNPTKYIPQWGGFCSWGISGETCPPYAWAADCLGPSGSWANWAVFEGSYVLESVFC